MILSQKLTYLLERYWKYEQIGYERQMELDRTHPLILNSECKVNFERNPLLPVSRSDTEYPKLGWIEKWGYNNGMFHAIQELTDKYTGGLERIMLMNDPRYGVF